MVAHKKSSEKEIASSEKIYIDSNIWVNYLWTEKVTLPKTFAGENERRKIDREIIKLLPKRGFGVVSSLFIESEISKYFTDYLRFLHGVSVGFDYTDSHKYKQEFSLSGQEKIQIQSYFEHINKLDFVETVELNLDAKAMKFFRLATCEYNIDYMDAFHLIVAMISACKYLITEDKDFIRKGNSLLKKENLIESIRLINGKEAVHFLRK